VSDWNLNAQDPLNLVLSADPALGVVDPKDDQIWEVALGTGDPPAMAVRTSFGRRVMELRYFPVFMQGNETICDPREFHSPPILKRMYPNYLEFECSPWEGVDVIMEYWVPGSRILAGRIALLIRDSTAGKLQVDWIGQLVPLGPGDVMIPEIINLTQVLVGQCGGIVPVCFISGGCSIGNSVYPGLSLEINPRKTTQQVFTWASAGFAEKDLSYNAARNATFRNWDAEISRVEITNKSRMLEIRTGNQDWDAVLHASQKTAFSLVMPAGTPLTNPTFVHSRMPEEGFSSREDGKDQSPGWTGQSALDSLYLARLMLPGGAEFLRGLLMNYLENQHKSGRLDWSLGMSGQRSQVNAQPVIAQLALLLSPYFSDQEWLVTLLPHLIKFYKSWFQPFSDRDRDGFPEWKSCGQAGLETLKIPWMENLESPGLAAILLNEARAIRKISEILEEIPDQTIDTLARGLEKHMQDCWDPHEGSYRYRDYETHLTTKSETIFESKGEKTYPLKKKFESPRRLTIYLKIHSGLNKTISIMLNGRSAGKAVTLALKSWDFIWQPDRAVYTTRFALSQLDQMRVSGLNAEDELRLETSDSSMIDISLLLPLATETITREQVETLVQQTIPAHFFSDCGLKTRTDAETTAPVQYSTFLLEGLMDQGEYASAARVMTSMLDELARKLKNRRDPFSNSLENTIPISSFLRLCGIESITNDEVILKGFNPFLQIVSVAYRGVVIMLHLDKSVVLLHQREPIEITNPERICIPLGRTMERSK
jgi:hypothetical protein